MDGQQAVCESLYKRLLVTLQDSEYDLDKKWRLLDLAVEILKKSPFELKDFHSAKIRALVLRLSNGDDTTAALQKLAKAFLAQCTNRE